MHNQPGPAAQQNEQQATGSVELSLRIGQRVRHQDFAGRRVTGVIRGLSIDDEHALSAEVVLDDAIVLPPISEQDREVRIYRLQVPAHELTPFDERDELIAEMLAALRADEEWRAREADGALDPDWDYERMVGDRRRAAIAKASGAAA